MNKGRLSLKYERISITETYPAIKKRRKPPNPLIMNSFQSVFVIFHDKGYCIAFSYKRPTITYTEWFLYVVPNAHLGGRKISRKRTTQTSQAASIPHPANSSPKSAAHLPIPTATPLAHLGDIVPERSEW
jgi:hypothetical protein